VNASCNEKSVTVGIKPSRQKVIGCSEGVYAGEWRKITGVIKSTYRNDK
jgi:hypothetical protein